LLSPVQIFDAAVAAAKVKTSRPAGRTFAFAVLAGVFIGLGAMFMLVVRSDSSLPFAMSTLLGGLVFCLGLLSVMVAGAELFTGNSLMVLAAWEKKIPVAELLKSWALVWAGNLAGAVALAFVLSLAGFGSLNSGAVGETAASVALAKSSLPAVEILVRGVLCNFLVCLAVWMGFSADSVGGKLAAAVLPVSAFVAAGFEHCVANMFFMPMGWLCGATLDPVAVLSNIALSTVGNVLGGAVAFAGLYWLALHPER
jgi:formate/nitrite transporter